MQNDITTAQPDFENVPFPTDHGWRGPTHSLALPFDWISCGWCGFHAAIPSGRLPKFRYKHLRQSWVCPDCGLKIELCLRSDYVRMVDFLRVCRDLLRFVESHR